VRCVAGRRARSHPHARTPGAESTTDGFINKLSAKEKRTVVSKDTDFYYSHLLTQQPYKLVLVRTGNIGVRELKELFARNLPKIERALARHSLVEVDRTTVHVVV
jgi:predicted nuclease of predicted toxin-antitoxin system